MLNKVLAERAASALGAEVAELRRDCIWIERAVKGLLEKFGLRSAVTEPSVYYEQGYITEKALAALVEVVFPSSSSNRLILAAVYAYNDDRHSLSSRVSSIAPFYLTHDDACPYLSLPYEAPTLQLFSLIALAAAIGEEEGALSLNVTPYPIEATMAYSVTVEDMKGRYGVRFAYGVHGGRQYRHQRHLRQLLIGTASKTDHDIVVTPAMIREFIDEVKTEAAVQLLSWR